ncbi:MAG TPA: thioredoxin family protein [Spirochaetota bacterium]|nr:thioredoxin family protein [Spirochaetota bacterium]
MKIEIIGSGDRCFQQLYDNLKSAIIKQKIIAPIKVYEPEEAPPAYKYSALPALFINEKLVAGGKVLSVKKIEKHFI